MYKKKSRYRKVPGGRLQFRVVWDVVRHPGSGILLGGCGMWVILGMALLAVLIVSAVFTRKLMKVDIEEIIRSEE